MTTPDEHRLNLEVVRIDQPAAGVRAVHLAQMDRTDLPPWTPGAHIDVEVGELIRQYSLCGDPADRSIWRIGVLLEPDSRGGSRFVHDSVELGDKLTVVGPRNNFELLPAEEYLFIAGGIGITPLLPMIANAQVRGLPWRLLYGGRQRATMAFLDELEAYGDHVRVVAEDEEGRPDLAAAMSACGPNAHVYACGPEPLLDAVTEQVAASRIAALHVERFRAKEVLDDTKVDQGFEVVLERSGMTIRVRPDEALVDAVTDAGVDVTTSCREGICGSCETRVLGGVPLHRDSLLSEEEQAANDTMMICVGRARSARLVLDL